jgi:hypothetical protein
LFVAADGARPHKCGESELCRQARDIIKQVDWNCEVQTLFQDENLGCGKGEFVAMQWFFDNVEEGIIVEDDTLPHASFFPYCAELLAKYRNDTRIMMISGYNPLQIWHPQKHDYFFSVCGNTWGWASWRRAWQHYDYHMRLWRHPAAVEAVRANTPTKFLFKRRKALYTKYFNLGAVDEGIGKRDSWDSQWVFCRLINSGMTIVPSRNLIQNIGFNEFAVHTTVQFFPLPTLQDGLEFPLRDNPIISVDREFDLRSTKLTSLTYWRKFVTFIRVDTKTKIKMAAGFIERMRKKYR